MALGWTPCGLSEQRKGYPDCLFFSLELYCPTRYNEARQLIEQQDKYCTAAEAGHWSGLSNFPDDLKWEALADVIRGKVKVGTINIRCFLFSSTLYTQVHNHCYEAVDFDGMVRVSDIKSWCSVDQFCFGYSSPTSSSSRLLHSTMHTRHIWSPILSRKLGGLHPRSPSSQLIQGPVSLILPDLVVYALRIRYKREAYRGSEFAPRIMADNGLRVVMKVVLTKKHFFPLY